jgi:glycine dehydrogenase subunit 1
MTGFHPRLVGCSNLAIGKKSYRVTFPHTDAERQQMLSAIGVTTIEDLFEAVPAGHRFPSLNLPEAMSEMEVMAELLAFAEANEHSQDFVTFRGAGAYHHFIPSVVNHITLAGNFTPPTPRINLN